MPTLTCPACSAVGKIPASAVGKTVRCPGCRTHVRVDAPAVAAPRLSAPASEVLTETCGACGTTIRAPRDLAGRRVRCTACREPVRLGATERGSPTAAARERAAASGGGDEQRRRASDERRRAQTPRGDAARVGSLAGPPVGAGAASYSWGRLPLRVRAAIYGLLVCMLPLVFLTLFPTNQEELRSRYEHAVRENASSLEDLPAGAELGDVLDRLPQGRIPGALLSHQTEAHWLFALASGAIFLTLAVASLRHSGVGFGDLAGVALFTGTIGIVLLLGLQLLARLIEEVTSWGSSPLALLVYLVNFVGYCYRQAFAPTAGAIDSVFGFIFSVGVCEELCKLLPLIWLVRRAQAPLDWRALLLLGVASGVGFGVSEGVHYATTHYNGVQGGTIYLVRFVSCVALHASFTAAAAILIAGCQHAFRPEARRIDLFAALCEVLWVSVLLHGLYDALLKLDRPYLALVCALATVAVLARRILVAARGVARGAAPAAAPTPGLAPLASTARRAPRPLGSGALATA